MGLLGKHHGELNSARADPRRYKELREEYKNDKVALQQIDVYDPGATGYHEHLREYTKALKEGDDARADKHEAWFKENYPDL